MRTDVLSQVQPHVDALRRQSLLENLISMGFPFDWALRASETCPDITAAISWIIEHMSLDDQREDNGQLQSADEDSSRGDEEDMENPIGSRLRYFSPFGHHLMLSQQGSAPSSMEEELNSLRYDSVGLLENLMYSPNSKPYGASSLSSMSRTQDRSAYTFSNSRSPSDDMVPLLHHNHSVLLGHLLEEAYPSSFFSIMEHLKSLEIEDLILIVSFVEISLCIFYSRIITCKSMTKSSSLAFSSLSMLDVLICGFKQFLQVTKTKPISYDCQIFIPYAESRLNMAMMNWKKSLWSYCNVFEELQSSQLNKHLSKLFTLIRHQYLPLFAKDLSIKLSFTELTDLESLIQCPTKHVMTWVMNEEEDYSDTMDSQVIKMLLKCLDIFVITSQYTIKLSSMNSMFIPSSAGLPFHCIVWAYATLKQMLKTLLVFFPDHLKKTSMVIYLDLWRQLFLLLDNHLSISSPMSIHDTIISYYLLDVLLTYQSICNLLSVNDWLDSMESKVLSRIHAKLWKLLFTQLNLDNCLVFPRRHSSLLIAINHFLYQSLMKHSTKRLSSNLCSKHETPMIGKMKILCTSYDEIVVSYSNTLDASVLLIISAHQLLSNRDGIKSIPLSPLSSSITLDNLSQGKPRLYHKLLMQ